jgi:hypothetical protein
MFNRACLFLSRMDEPPASYCIWIWGKWIKKVFFKYSYAIARQICCDFGLFYAIWMEVEWRIGETIWRIWGGRVEAGKEA